jgi:hypothetical protein
MSHNDFIKGVCRHCAGHMEFPAAAAGQTVACPHCGQPTPLVPAVEGGKPGGSRHRWLGILGALVVVGAVAAGALWYLHQAGGKQMPEAGTLQPVASSAPGASTPAPAPKPPPKSLALATTNDFAIMPFALESTPGSSLVYVTGVVQNVSARQRFGIKVTFGLCDTNDRPIGAATDYQGVMEPQSEWHFRAMVMESKAVSARFTAIAEDK